MNKLIQHISFVILGFVFFNAPSYAGDVVVIVNKANNQQLTLQDVKNIYNDQIGSWNNGNKIIIHDLQVDSQTKEVFAQKVLGKSAQAATSAVSRRKVNNTLKNPPKVKRERLVASIVSKKPNAIGYVSPKSIKGKTGIRVVLELKN